MSQLRLYSELRDITTSGELIGTSNAVIENDAHLRSCSCDISKESSLTDAFKAALNALGGTLNGWSA